MRALLRTAPEGVPDDCLAARIRGRRSFLVSDWDRLEQLPEPLDGLGRAPWRSGFQDEGEGWPRRALQHEYARLFGWMGEPLRRVLAPFFWLEEVRTIGICLRSRAGGSQGNQDLLRWSLLDSPLRTLLDAPAGIPATVDRLSALLAFQHADFKRLPAIYRSGGTGTLEAALWDISLQCRRSDRHPVVERCLALLIDDANLAAIAKALRWKLADPPELRAGGSLRCAHLRELAARGDRAGLARLAAGLGGGGREGDPDELERTIATARQIVLTRLAREADGIGAIIGYLWRCSSEAAAIGLLARQKIAGSELVAREIGA